MKNLKSVRSTSFLLVIFLILVLIPVSLILPVSATEWDGVSVAPSFAGGDGTQSDPFLISNATELAYLAKMVNENNTFEGQYIKLTSDILLGGKSWTPIGNYMSTTEIFMGNFNGDGHKITGFYCNTPEEYAGLFGYVIGATVENLTISGIECIGGLNVGVVAAFSEGETKIINCVSSVNYVQGAQVGGVLGRTGLIKGTLILACTNYSKVYCVGSSKYGFAAGIASAVGGGTVAYCANYGDVGGEAVTYVSAGGIVGMQGADDVQATIQYCFNSGNISANAGNTKHVGAGGIVGRANHMQFGEISNCASIGTYTTNEEGRGGAIFGYNVNIGIIENCYTDSTTAFGYDTTGAFQGDEVTILPANDIRGAAGITNMNLDPTLFTSVPNELPALKTDAIVAHYFAAADPEETTIVDEETTAPQDDETTAPEDTTTSEEPLKSDTTTNTPDVTTKPEDGGGCGGSVTSNAIIVISIIGLAALLLKRVYSDKKNRASL